MIRISSFKAVPQISNETPIANESLSYKITRNKYSKLQTQKPISERGKAFGEFFFPLFHSNLFEKTKPLKIRNLSDRTSQTQQLMYRRIQQNKRCYSTKITGAKMDLSLLSQDSFTFKEATSDQVELLKSWLKKPHISKYWGDGGMAIPDFLKFTTGEPSVFKHYFGFYDDLPVVFLMTSIVEEGDSFGKWKEKSGENLTLDIMIGDENFVGKGCGHLILQAFIEKNCQDAVAILVDPELAHEKAIHVYKKAGFEPQGTYIPDEGGWSGIEHLIMKKIIN